MAKTNHPNCDPGDTCGAPHEIITFKNNLSMTLLGANLFGILVVAVMVAYGQLKGIPEMEQRLTAKITPIVERVAILEEWKKDVERREAYAAKD